MLNNYGKTDIYFKTCHQPSGDFKINAGRFFSLGSFKII